MNLSDSQIDFILSDIKRRGVVSSALQEDLLDHICCLIEEKFRKDDFQTAYQKALTSLGSLRALQHKTTNVVLSSGRVAILFRCLEYCFTLIYLILGIVFLLLPLFILIAKSEFLIFVLLFPLFPFGCFMCFTRINYKKFQLISFPSKASPGNLVFH